MRKNRQQAFLCGVCCGFLLVLGACFQSKPSKNKGVSKQEESNLSSRDDSNKSRRRNVAFPQKKSKEGRVQKPPMLAPSLSRLDSPKVEEKEKDKKTSKVWKKTSNGTILSRVSVGGKKYLRLEKLRVTVQVEGLRVRTILDHIYFNPHARDLEGTFQYTLPAHSSVSYYAMFVGQQGQIPRFFGRKSGDDSKRISMQPQEWVKQVSQKEWGVLREGRLVPAEKARKVFEYVTRKKIDPALLEEEAPNTFSGRVYPIQKRGYNRVILAYEQTLPLFDSQRLYRFSFPPEVAKTIEMNVSYDSSHSILSKSNLSKRICKVTSERVRCFWEDAKPKEDAILRFSPKNKQLEVIASEDPVDQKKYFFGQWKIPLSEVQKGASASNALFLLDTSLSVQPDHFSVYVQLLEKILKNNSQIKQFNVLLFDVHARWFWQKWVPNDASHRKQFLKTLNSLLLEGATDLSEVFRRIAKPRWVPEIQKQEVDFFLLSDGQLSWGSQNSIALAKTFWSQSAWKRARFFAYTTGMGTENISFFENIASKGGSLFHCLGASELDACSIAHTKASLVIQSLRIHGIGAKEFLVAGRQRTVFPGNSISFSGSFLKNGKATLHLKGLFGGNPFSLQKTFLVSAKGELACRAFGEIAVAQLLNLDDDKNTEMVVALSQHFRIPNKHVSFLVLETDKEYKQYDLEETKKKKKIENLAAFFEKKYDVVEKVPSLREQWRIVLKKGIQRGKMLEKSSGRAVLQLLQQTAEQDFHFSSAISSKAWYESDVSSDYLKKRLLDRNDFSFFLQESQKRIDEKKIQGAIRSLSSIVELHPSNPKALRMVGNYLMIWKHPEQAGNIFLKVLEQRSFEPHSYRDLARILLPLKRFSLAAALYEIILANTWSPRFGNIHRIVSEEYALLLQEAFRAKGLEPSVRNLLETRKRLLGLEVRPSKLRVTLTWNTDNTDIDLHVLEPNGETCSFRKKRTSNGGTLLEDITQGYGPERYENIDGMLGNYKILLKFYGHRSNTFGNETHATVQIITNAGTTNQVIQEKHLILKKQKDIVDVHTVQF